jgi:hypothetical protein
MAILKIKTVGKKPKQFIMKKNLNLKNGWAGMGAALMALMATAAAAHAQDVLSDLGTPATGSATSAANQYKSQGFVMGGTVGAEYNISQIILALNFVGSGTTSANVYLAAANASGIPTTSVTSSILIGTVGGTETTVGTLHEYDVTLNSLGLSDILTGGQDCALIIDSDGNGGTPKAANVTWQFSRTAVTGFPLGLAWDGNGTIANWNEPGGSGGVDTQVRSMELEYTAVPEPSTEALMVLGAAGLLISVRRQRKNLKTSV